MSIRGARDQSLTVVLALLGMALCAGSLLMRWVAIDLAMFEQAVRNSPGMAERMQEAPMSDAQWHAALQSATDLIMSRLEPEMVGYRVLSVGSVVLFVATMVLVVVVLRGFMNRGGTRATLAAQLGVVGGLLLFRPVWTYFRIPAEQDVVSAAAGGKVIVAGTGLYVAVVGALLVIGSALLAHRAAAAGLDEAERIEQEQAQALARTGGGGLVPPASVGAPGFAAPAMAQAPVPYQAVVPGQPAAQPYVPQPAAPQPYGQPYVPLAQQPAAAAAPPYGQAAPPSEPPGGAAPPPRAGSSGSVPPPGHPG